MSRGEFTRKQILETAVKIASVEGIEGLTIGELAKAVGMSKSGLYAHFEAKDSLQLMVLKIAAERFVNFVIKPATKELAGEPRVRKIFENWLTYLNDESVHPGGSVFIAASFELDDRPGILRDYLEQAQKDLIQSISKAARIAVEAKHFRKDLDTELFAWSLYSFVLGYHHYKRMLNDPKADFYVRNSFEGLMSISKNKKEQVS